MDEADMAQRHIEAALAAQLNRREPAGPAATGVCLHCVLPLPEARRWCNAACRDGWEREHAPRRR